MRLFHWGLVDHWELKYEIPYTFGSREREALSRGTA